MSIFEAIMLVMFGAAWPVNISKSLRTKSSKGKSPVFLILIEIGYISGMINKFLYSRDIVLVLYMINFLMVLTDLVLYYVYLNREKKASK